MDFGIIIALLGACTITTMIGLSYAGAYMMGKAKGRLEAEQEGRGTYRPEVAGPAADRILMVESAVDTVARSMSRLADAQRIMVDEQARLSEKLVGSSSRLRSTPPS
jgi:hypothetical protein